MTLSHTSSAPTDCEYFIVMWGDFVFISSYFIHVPLKFCCFRFALTYTHCFVLYSRLGSDPPKPHPLSKASRKRSLPDTSSVPHSQTSIHPDSAVAGKTGQLLSGSKSSIYTHSSSDRYTKLDDVTGFHSSPRQLPSSNPADKFSSFQTHVEKSGAYRNPTKEKKLEHLHMTKEDKMAMIRDDISRFSNSKQSASSSSSSIPAVSSRWSRFMTESEEGGEEGESVQTHMLQSRTGIARYN